MKRSVLAFVLSLTTYFGFGQCGPYALTKNDSTCTSYLLSVSSASAAQQIIWNLNGIFDTVSAGLIGPVVTTAGGNGQGSATNQLNQPSNVYVDSYGNIYVADSYRIQKFPSGSTSTTNGITVAGGNGYGHASNQIGPTGVSVDNAGNIYVSDAINNRIQKFPAGSTSITNGTTVAGGNGSGSDSNQLSNIWGVFVDSGGNIYVADGNNNRIQKFPTGSTSITNGITVAGGNGSGNAANQFNLPTGVCLDNAGNIYVVDRLNSRIQKFPAGSTSNTYGTTVAGGNGQGSAANQLNYPYAMYVDSLGNIYIADNGNYRIQKFPAGSTSTTSGITVAGGNGAGSTSNQFNSAIGVFLDGPGNVYVADYYNNRIQKWSQPPFTGIDTSILVTSNGIYSVEITDISGCTASSNSIAITHLNSNTVISQNICPGNTYIFGGQNLSSAGVYYDTLTSTSGCDSMLTLILTTNTNPGSSISQAICQGMTYPFYGHNISAPGTYFDTLTSASGCDSIITLTLMVNTFFSTSYDQIICQGSTYNFGGHSLSAAGIYTDTLTSSFGCDSIVTVDLILNPTPGPYTLKSTDSACTSLLTLTGSYDMGQIVWNINGNAFDTIEASIPAISTVAGGNGPGNAANQFNASSGICMDASGNIYVADHNNNRIQKFAPGSTSATYGVTVAGGNGAGSAANQFEYPTEVFVDSVGNIYVADTYNNRIQKFPAGSSSASYGITVAGGNGQGTAGNQLNNPEGVYVDGSGNIYVADALGYRIQKFPAGSTSATYATTVAGGNGAGSAANQFYWPSGLYVDVSGNVYVADHDNNRIQKFPTGSTSATNGITVAGGNGLGWAANQLNGPWSVYVDNQGSIYVADYWNNRVQKFPAGSDPSTPGTTIAGGNGQGSAPNQLYFPYSVCLDHSGYIYIADDFNNRIQKWSSTNIDTSISVGAGTYSALITSTYGCTAASNIITVNPSVTAHFTLQPSSITQHLWYAINQCTGTGLSYIWSWGDSTTSIGDTPSHTYAAAGYYNVCVSVTDSAGCTATYCDTNVYLFKDQSGQMVYINVVNQIPSGINTISADNLNINYYAGAVHFSESLQSPTGLKLYDLSGRVVMQQDNFSGSTWNINSGIAQGVYIMHLQSGNYSYAKKLMIIQQ